MRKAELVRLIHTNLIQTGTGVMGDPIRSIDQYWSLDGKLLFESDIHDNNPDIEVAKDIIRSLLSLPPVKQAEKNAVPGSSAFNLLTKARVFVDGEI